MKKIILTSLIASWFCIAFCADTFYVAGVKYKKLNNSSVEVCDCSSGVSGDLTILPLVKENSSSSIMYTVTSIEDKAFSSCELITSIKIPNSVTSIGDYAFEGCSGLTSVEIPNSVTYIGSRAFKDCYGLTSINIPNSVTSIEEGAFHYCEGLKSIKIPNSVTSIGESAFRRCSALTSIEIPNSVTSIGRGAFSGCSNIVSIIVDKNNKVYESTDNCDAIIETKTGVLIAGCNTTKVPNNVTGIGYGAFDGRKGLTSIEIPHGVTSIGDYAFYGCSGLTSIEIPNSVTYIGQYAFYNCSGLTSIELPQSVTYIGSSAFEYCYGLTSIEIPNSVTTIRSETFSHCSSLTSIKIPEGATSIGSYAFEFCSSLTSVEIPFSVTSIGDKAFYYCSNLNKIVCYAPMPPEVYASTFQEVSKEASVYVMCNSIDYYKIYWNYFNSSSFKCITLDPIDEEISGTVVEPTATSVVLKWELEAGANKYTFVITKGGVTVCTLTISSDGTLISIEYPQTASTRGAELRNANVTVKGYSFEVDGLEPETTYQYTMNALNSSGDVIKTYAGQFTTLKTYVSVDEFKSGTNVSLKDKVSISGREVSVSGAEASDVKIYNTAGQQVGNPVPAAGVYLVTVGSESAKVLVK